MFLTLFGNPWKKDSVSADIKTGKLIGKRQEAVGAEFHKLLVKAKAHRKGIGFYSLRHTFRTWADESNDQHAMFRIMGHAIPGMSGTYVEEISTERLKKVTDCVRGKLYTAKTTAAEAQVPQSSPHPPQSAADDDESPSAQG
jgi:hypothetical protein